MNGRAILVPLALLLPLSSLTVALDGVPSAGGRAEGGGTPGGAERGGLLADPWPTRIRDLGAVPLEGLARAVGDVLDEAWGAPAEQGPAGTAATVGEGENAVWREAFAAGDINGDGLEDALVAERGGGANLFRAVSGLDGSTLWLADAGPFNQYDSALLPAGDVTGDGRGDLLRLTLEYDFGNETNESEPAPQHHEPFTWTWRLSLFSGADGTTPWALAFGGAETVTRGALSTKYEVANYYVLPFLSGDHDADGLADLVVDAVGWDSTYLVTGNRISSGYRTVATLLDADTGDVLFSRGERVEGGYVLLLPAGQTVGSAAGDLLWTRFEQPRFGGSSIRLDMWDGASFESAWRAAFGGGTRSAFEAFPLGCDATGDGSEDLLAFVFDPPFGATTMLVSGADGSVAWQRPLFTGLCLGPIGGAPGDDLLTLDFDAVFLYNETTLAITLPRTDGATGEELFRTEPKFAAPEGYGTIDLEFAGDGDADGVQDLLLFQRRGGGGHEHEEGNETDNETRSARTSVLVESGGGGHALLERTFDVYATSLAAGDLNADGYDDLLLAWDAATSYGDLGLTLEAVPLATDAGGWTRAWEFEAAGAQLVLTGDQAGDGGADVLVTVNQFLQGVRSRVESVHGGSGATSWAVGDDLVGGPAPGGQDDAASGGDAPDSLFDALPIPEGSYAGRLEGSDTVDFYQVKPGAESILSATVTPLEGQDVRVSLYRATFDEYGDFFPELLASSDLPGDAAETVLGASGRATTFWIAVGTTLGDGDYALDVARTPLPVDRFAASGYVDCMAGRVSCGDANENTTVTFELAGPPGAAVVGLRYLPTTPAQRVVVDVLANGELVTILTTVNDAEELTPAQVEAFWPAGGTVEFRARGPLLGAGDLPFGVVVDQPFRVCAAFADTSAPGLACFT